MKVIECDQGSTAWLLARCGIPTASEFHELITPARKARESEGRESYLLRKVAEKFMGYPADGGQTFPMQQGSIIETIARPWYEFTYDVKVKQVGFCTTDDGRIGCSPDGLIGEDGGIEIKSPEDHTHLKYLLAGGVPPQYLAQVHGSLYVTGRKWWKFVSYSRYFPSLVVHVERDEAWIAALDAVLKSFLKDFDAARAKINDLMPKDAQ